MVIQALIVKEKLDSVLIIWKPISPMMLIWKLVQGGTFENNMLTAILFFHEYPQARSIWSCSAFWAAARKENFGAILNQMSKFLRDRSDPSFPHSVLTHSGRVWAQFASQPLFNQMIHECFYNDSDMPSLIPITRPYCK